ncbi:hypothetical protein F5X99DRAFT_393243 [Biscogniauxia marginata]|nr:hypothetical protein F5X99DRAFT_393243 [Biscogniauxia marginata]
MLLRAALIVVSSSLLHHLLSYGRRPDSAIPRVASAAFACFVFLWHSGACGGSLARSKISERGVVGKSRKLPIFTTRSSGLTVSS